MGEGIVSEAEVAGQDPQLYGTPALLKIFSAYEVLFLNSYILWSATLFMFSLWLTECISTYRCVPNLQTSAVSVVPCFT